MNKPWVTAIAADKIKPGHYEVVTINLISLVIGNSNGRYFAVQNICTHDGGELAGGEIEGEEIICPRHGAGFCIKTGAVTRPPAYEDIQHFPVRVNQGNIEIQL